MFVVFYRAAKINKASKIHDNLIELLIAMKYKQQIPTTRNL